MTRNGAPAAALVPIDEYEALEETAEILSDPDALAALEIGLADIGRDETVTLADLRSELAERRAATGRSLAMLVLARRARRELLELIWPLIDAIEDALGPTRARITGWACTPRQAARSVLAASWRLSDSSSTH